MATLAKRKSKRLIKLNKKKITIWVIVITILVTGVSLVLYFTLRPNKGTWPSQLKETTVSGALEKADSYADSDEKEIWGLFIGSTDIDNGCPYCVEAIYGTQDIDKNTQAEGEFSTYLSVSSIPWYSIDTDDVESANEAFLEFFRGLYDADETNVGISDPIIMLPNTDDAIETGLLQTDSYDNLTTSNNVVVLLNDGSLTGTSSFINSSDDGSSASLAIPGFIWMYGDKPFAMSIGFSAKTTNEDGSETVPQTDEFFIEAENLISDWTNEIS